MRWYGAAALCLALPIGWMATRVLLGIGGASGAQPFFGVRLGMTAQDIRTGFALPGAWRSEAGALGEGPGAIVLEWRPADPVTSPVRAARFELHDGFLVALRAQLAPSSAIADGPAFDVNDQVVRHRERVAAGVRYTVLARSCPTHADEVQRLLASRD
ncbi:MAG: hypothetical protein KC543_08545 [Myxococcales bacterium]|nr:hypothetical protein [Myxococcales bacterium]